MHKVGDWILVKRIQPYAGFVKVNEQLPRWACVMITPAASFKYSVEFLPEFDGYRGMWGVDESDIVPHDEITDEQWTQLVVGRLLNA